MKNIKKEKDAQSHSKKNGPNSSEQQLKTDIPLSEKDQVKEAEEKVRKGLKQ